MTGPAAATDRIHWPTAISRAFFLACSWTWCIGMWLPLILIREFGWMGFVAFAIPNVLGAAAMGLVLRRPGASEAITTRFAPAIRWFAVVTIAFQAFFVTWRIGRALDWVHIALIAAPAAVLFASALGLRRISSRAWGVFAIIAWFGSATLLAAAFYFGRSHYPLPPGSGESLPIGLLWLTPVMAFGFGACPFLDPTFHRVRREVPGRTGSAAFILGFVVLFLPMILATAAYAGSIIVRQSISYYILGHIFLQCIFTVGAHAREIESRRLLTPILFGVAVALIPVSTFLARLQMTSEDIYRVFMGFYGLVFPAYVWIVMTPRRAPGGLALWAFATALALPCFWMGFIEQRWFWLAPGLAIVLLAPLAGRFPGLSKAPK